MTVQPPDWIVRSLKEQTAKWVWGLIGLIVTALVWPVIDQARALLDVPATLKAQIHRIEQSAAENAARDDPRDVAVASLVASVEVLTSNSAANSAALEELASAVIALQQPSSVFDIADNSGAVDGYCIENMPCEMLLRIRRTEAGEPCQIISDSSRYFFINLVTGQRIEVNAINPPEAKNVGLVYTDLRFSFVTPSGLVTDASQGQFAFRSSYTRCAGESGLVVVDESPLIPTPIYRTVNEVTQ